MIRACVSVCVCVCGFVLLGVDSCVWMEEYWQSTGIMLPGLVHAYFGCGGVTVEKLMGHIVILWKGLGTSPMVLELELSSPVREIPNKTKDALNPKP